MSALLDLLVKLEAEDAAAQRARDEERARAQAEEEAQAREAFHTEMEATFGEGIVALLGATFRNLTTHSPALHFETPFGRYDLCSAVAPRIGWQLSREHEAISIYGDRCVLGRDDLLAALRADYRAWQSSLHQRASAQEV